MDLDLDDQFGLFPLVEIQVQFPVKSLTWKSVVYWAMILNDYDLYQQGE